MRKNGASALGEVRADQLAAMVGAVVAVALLRRAV